MKKESGPSPPVGTLVLFPGALGDAVCAEPVVTGLAASDPVEFWARGGAAEVASLFPSRPVVRSLDRPEVARLFAPASDVDATRETVDWLRRYRRVVSFTGASDAAATARFGEAGNATLAPFPARVGDEHAIDEMQRAVGLPPGGCPVLVPEGRMVPRPRHLVLHPGSGGAEKRASPALLERLIGRWQAAGGTVTVVLGPAESEEDRWRPLGTVVRPAAVAELARVVAEGSVYLGNDAGPSHVAAALAVPAVVAFVATAPERFGPRGPRVDGIRIREGADAEERLWAALASLLP